MSWTGSGSFARLFSWVADKSAGLDISSSRMDADTNDIASNGFGNCLTRDGQGFATANLPMGGFRHTGVGNGAARTDYAALGQLQDGVVNWVVAGGSADALTATYSPAVTAYVDGQLFFVRAGVPNATTTPTFAANALAAHTITKRGGVALVAGDIVGNLYECILRYNLANTRFELLNPGVTSNSAMALTNAWTLKGNPTSGSATPADFTIDGLTLKGSLAAADEFLIWDVAGAAMKKVLLATPAGALSNSAIGFALGMLNGTLVASVAASALTVAVKTLANADPSATDPVIFLVANGTGGWSVISQQAALSITVPSAASAGTVSGQANRLWVGVFNNSGTAVLGVYNALNSTGPSLVSWDETSAVSGTAVVGGSNSAQTWYTASSVTTKNFRIIGYVESTQATAGTWATSPSKVQVFGPGQKKPGDSVQRISQYTATGATTTSATFVALSSVITPSITPTSAANLIHARSGGHVAVGAGAQAQLTLSRGSVAATNLIGEAVGVASNTAWDWPAMFEADDIPNTTSSTTYTVQGKVTGGNTLTYGTGGLSGGNYGITLEEIQI